MVLALDIALSIKRGVGCASTVAVAEVDPPTCHVQGQHGQLFEFRELKTRVTVGAATTPTTVARPGWAVPGAMIRSPESDRGVFRPRRAQ